jgi:tetratricopeptide (TPR) repeat protein
MDNQTLLSHLRDLVDAQLVSAASAEAFEFRHALTREAVYATILKRQRTTYHSLVADTLEGLYGDEAQIAGRAADLAYHYREAANWPKALEYAQRAGEQAQNQYAPHEAAEHFTHAIEAAGQLGQPPDLRLLRGRGQAFETIGEFEHARADYELGLRLAREAGDAQAEWQALLDLGFLWAGRDYSRTGDYMQQALELARAGGEPLLVAHSLNRLGNWHVNTGRIVVGMQMHLEALDIFHDQGSDSGMAATRDLLGLVYSLIGDPWSAKKEVEQAIELFRRLGDKRGLIASLGAHSSLAVNGETLPWAALSLQASRQEAAEAVALAKQIGWLAGQAEVQWLFGLTLAQFGEFGEALAWANNSLRIASEIDHRQWTAAAHYALGNIHLLLLEPGSAARHLGLTRSLADELGSAWWIGYGGAFLAFSHLQLGQAPAARSELQSAAAAMGLEADWAARPPRTLVERYMCWAWAEAELADGQPAEALAAAGRLIESVVNPGGEPMPHLLKLKGQALAALGQPAEAEAALSLGLVAAREHKTLPILWQIQRERGRLARQFGRADDARRDLDAARAVIEELANTLDQPQRQAFRSRALSQLTSGDVLAAAQA